MNKVNYIISVLLVLIFLPLTGRTESCPSEWQGIVSFSGHSTPPAGWSIASMSGCYDKLNEDTFYFSDVQLFIRDKSGRSLFVFPEVWCNYHSKANTCSVGIKNTNGSQNPDSVLSTVKGNSAWQYDRHEPSFNNDMRNDGDFYKCNASPQGCSW
jgi:hypothetical protein